MELNQHEENETFIIKGCNKGSNREQWGNKCQSFLTLYGFTVSVGNLWRFPYLCMKNGGGAFLIPFVISGIFLAFPIFLLEVSLGQFTSKAVHKCWESCPLLKGIGYGMLITICISVNCVMIVTWTMYFIGSSFTSPLPWATCNNWWNTDDCFADVAIFLNSSNMTSHPGHKIVAKPLSSSAEEFFENKVLQLSSGIEDVGGFNIPLLLCLAGSWIVVSMCLMKGVKTIGKVVYVTATLPVLLIIILFIRSAIEPGAVDGILFFVTPDLNRLKDINVWIEAALQVLFSSGVLYGPLITMQGFNKFKNNCVRDAALVMCTGEGTSILAGFLVFSVLGSMAHQKGVTIQEVAKSGPGLAFIAYPEAVSRLPLPNLWAVLFFLMIYTLVLDTAFGTFEPMIAAVTDSFIKAREHRIKTTFLVVFLMILLSVPFTLKNGFYLLQLIDWYAWSITYPVFGFIECLIFGWIYVIVLYEPPSYGNYEYPEAATTCGFIIAMLPIIPIPIVTVYQIRKADGLTFIQKLKNATKPSNEWKPGRHEQWHSENDVDIDDGIILDTIKVTLFGRREFRA